MSLRDGGGSFDIDLAHGQVAEGLVKELLFGMRRVEVKREDNAPKYGTLYIETKHDPGAKGVYKPSGLSITTADYWAFVVQGLVLMAPTCWLRDQQSTCRRAEQPHGSVPTKGFRLPLSRFIQANGDDGD